MNDSAGTAAFDVPSGYPEANLWPAIRQLIDERPWPVRRAFDLGCGRGATCNMLSTLGFETVGVDVSPDRIAEVRRNYPHLRGEVGSAYDDLASKYGRFPLVTSLDVIEHCFDPAAFMRTFRDLMEPGGIGFISTPFHGYWKNLALAVTGKMERHFMSLVLGGHIKFFSEATLRQLIEEAGFTDITLLRMGRISPLAKLLVAVIKRDP